MTRSLWVAAALVAALAFAGGASASGTVGTSFPAGFPTITDASLGTPVIGFGAADRVTRTPVISLHGNNDTPFPTACNPFGYIHNLAQFFLDMGYSPRELWGLGYQGDQCDLVATPTNRSAFAHSTEANVPDLRAFVAAVLQYTGARRVDIVYISAQDGFFPAVPAEDRDGRPHDFSRSALLVGATSLGLTKQGQFDPIIQTAHLGILNSPSAWEAALEFLRSLDESRER